VTTAHRTPALLIPFIGDDVTRRKAIEKFQADVTFAQQIVKQGGQSPTGLDYLQDWVDKTFGTGGGNRVADKARAAGVEIGTLNKKIDEGTAPVMENAMHVEELAVNYGSAGGIATTAATGVKAVTEAISTANPTMTQFATIFDTVGKQAKFLDANLQPLGAEADNLAAVLGKATASLDAHKTAGQLWVDGAKAQIDANQKLQVELFNIAKGFQDVTVYEDDNIKVLQLLIEAHLAAAAGAYDLAAAKKAEANAMRNATKEIKTYAAAAVHLTNLIPTSKTLSGPRNPNFRLRSDYQRALIGSPQAQQQMLAGNRKKVYSKIKTKTAQHGMNEMVTDPTWVLMGEDGPEYARVTPAGKGGGGGGGMMTIRILPEEFARFMRVTINDNQGVVK
jgi:hypothetical protein